MKWRQAAPWSSQDFKSASTSEIWFWYLPPEPHDVAIDDHLGHSKGHRCALMGRIPNNPQAATVCLHVQSSAEPVTDSLLQSALVKMSCHASSEATSRCQVIMHTAAENWRGIGRPPVDKAGSNW
ncbi:hypothetical protein PGT21_007557 [Puccinia graminis f. sp. tritici]|uniref:Uncharacterized protein n=1 Tax=Puccinia graminis f. sp. tritici TaxID=56615 RepID=A0A5B0MDG7_PUCGR|nr:hypothetical protein PGTUg99_029510 [Puccinia graminis f. sp. tritici]KAA1116278.1 hypothetical protein PGT21_007557 [Puccinia graminis f. sp. tritici]